MKMSIVLKAAMVGVLAMGMATASVVPANAMNKVACGSRTDFLKFYATSIGNVCYSYAGTRSDQFDFQTFSSGNNAGFYTSSGHGDTYFGKNYSYSYATSRYAYVEHIN